MRSSNKLNFQNSGGIISKFRNGIISIFRNAVAWAGDLLTFKIEYKQLLAMWMICTLLLPIFAAPVSVSAVISNKQNEVEEDYSQFEPVNGDQSVLSRAATEANLAIERIFTPSLKVNNLSASVENVESDESELEKSENVTSDKNSESGGKKEEKGSEDPAGKSTESEDENLSVENSINKTDEKESVKNSLTENKSQNQTAATNSAVSSALLNNPLPDNERESVYSYENNLGSPIGQTEADSSNLASAIPIKHRAGIANYSFGLPLASLSGRGIDAGIGMTYNSRTWNKSITADPNNPNDPINHYTYDVEQSWIAPGFSTGLGYLESGAVVQYKHPYQSSNFQYHTEIVPQGITDADGGRHSFQCLPSSYVSFPGTYSSRCGTYRSSDGSFITVPGKFWTANPGNSQTPNTTGYENVTFSASYPNGMKVLYGGAFGSGTTRKHYPVMIEDSNGNRIRITYKTDNSGRIDYIIDTINRKIKFYYENDTNGNPDKLVAVTIPGMNQNEEIQTVRFYYEDNFALTPKTSTGGFETSSQVTAPPTVRVLKYVYFPSTKSGFKYDYHSNYGMIKKISRMVGMSVSDETVLTATGTMQNAGTWVASTEYDYPDGNTTVTDVPKYLKRTDDWQGRTSAEPQITEYNYPETNGYGEETSQIYVKDNGFYLKTETISRADGFLKETSVTKMSGPNGQFIKLISKDEYTWTGRNLTKVKTTITDSNNNALTKKTEYSYDGYGNQTQIKEYDYYANEQNAVLLRTTDIGYETGTNWISANLLRLTKSVKTTIGGAVVSKTLYEYDHNGDDSMTVPRNDIDTITHSTFYNPAYPAQTERFCPNDDPDLQNRDINGCVIVYTPGYSAASAYRGNVTKIGRLINVNATTIASDSNADVTNYNYDIAGNVVSATLSCCQLKMIDYGATFAETGYAFPTKETKGTSPQLIGEAVYNKNTGLITSTKDENNQITTYEYEADTLRQSKINYPNNGYVQTEYSDKLAPGSVIGFIRTKTTLDNTNTVQSYSYFDGRGLSIRSATETTGDWSISAVEYDSLGRSVKSYNPFYAATPNGAIPAGTAFSKAVAFDALGRMTQMQLQDGATVNNYFNEESVTFTAPGNVSITGTSSRVVDQAGKERRQIIDSLGRIVRVDEPTNNGLGSVAAPAQPTYYFYDGNDNLAKTIQSDGTTIQERVFRYDSLSRLTHERQIEAVPTLSDNGLKEGSPAPTKWTKVLKYNLDGLVSEGTDARGVKTTFSYDGLNRLQSVIFSDGTPAVTYTYDQARTGFFNKGALTRVETADGGTARPDTPATATEFDYDKMGRVVKHRQSINSQVYNLEYEYNLAGQLTSKKYPSGRIVSTSYDAKGRLSNIADAQRTYLSGLQFQGKANSLSSMTYGNGAVQTLTLNDRLQITRQELKRGAETLQKYDYGYGQIDTSTGTIAANSNNGQLAKVESTIGISKQLEQRFGYDSVGRLSESREQRGDNGSLAYKQNFDYDRFGNLYRKNSSNPTTGQQTPIGFTPIESSDISKATNHFTTDTQYDDAGNVVQDTKYRNQNFWYDANGRMYKTQRINFPNQSNAVYDASGMRVANQVDGIWTFSVYDIGGKKVAEYGGLQPTDEGGVKYILSDYQGSNRAVINNAGFVNARTDYTAFGEDIGSNIGQRTTNQGFGSSNIADQKYALTERDKATGLDHTWFRKHENAAGRWTSPDPYNGSMNILEPQSFNRYSYANNQPTNFVDPSGLNAESGSRCWLVDSEGDRYQGVMRDGKCVADGASGAVTVYGSSDPFTLTGNAAILALWNPTSQTSRVTWTISELVESAGKVIDEAEKDGKSDCAKLLGEKAAEKFKEIAKNIKYDSKKFDSPLDTAETIGEDIYLNPYGYAFRETNNKPIFSGNSAKKLNGKVDKAKSQAPSEYDFAVATVIHEFLHAIEKFGPDSNGFDSKQSQKNQGKVLKACFPKAK